MTSNMTRLEIFRYFALQQLTSVLLEIGQSIFKFGNSQVKIFCSNLNPHSHPSGCYGVIDTRGLSPDLTWGLYHTVFKLYLSPFIAIVWLSLNFVLSRCKKNLLYASFQTLAFFNLTLEPLSFWPLSIRPKGPLTTNCVPSLLNFFLCTSPVQALMKQL